jgi:hypothetical protein
VQKKLARCKKTKPLLQENRKPEPNEPSKTPSLFCLLLKNIAAANFS